MGLRAIYLCSENLSSIILFFHLNQQNFAFFIEQVYGMMMTSFGFINLSIDPANKEILT